MSLKHLSHASSLCGNCTEVCAVKINIHELLLDNRKEAAEEGLTSFGEKAAWKIWKFASMHRGVMNMGNGPLKNTFVNGIFKDWTKHRGDLNFSKKTFNELWKDKNKN